MEALIIAIVTTCLAGVVWVLQEVAKKHVETLTKIKPGVTESLAASVDALKNWQNRTNAPGIKTEELEKVCEYLPIIKKIKFKNAIKKYNSANTWELVNGCYVPSEPDHLLSACEELLKILS